MHRNVYISINGVFHVKTSPVIGIGNSAFLYGDSVVETMHALGSEVQFFSKHFQRIIEAMLRLKMDIPPTFTQSFLAGEIARLMQKNRQFMGTRVKLTICRSDGENFVPKTNGINYIIELDELENDKYVFNTKGLMLKVFNDYKKHFDILSPFCTGNSIVYVLAEVFRKAKNVDDVIILNYKDNIVETINANIFFVKNNALFTPPYEDGCVAGVCRSQIMKIAKLHDIPVIRDRNIGLEALELADEIFLTNVVYGIRWVMGYEGFRYRKNMSQFLLKELNKVAFENKENTE